MATRTIARMYDDHATARAAVAELESAGFSSSDVSLVAGDSDGRYSSTTGTATTTTETTDSGSGAGVGATLGTVLGGGAGLLAGIGALAIPGVGPIVAAGALVAALTGAGAGAAAGGLVGALAGGGLSDDESRDYATGVERGGTLVTVRADETRAHTAEAILDRHGPVDMAERRSTYGTTTTTGLTSDHPDGTGDNPRGTMLSRGTDDVLGTNISGARPEHEVRSTTAATTGATAGTVGTGLGMGAGAAAAAAGMGAARSSEGVTYGRDTSLTSSSPDGTGDNPRGTMLSRGVDDALGTNISGARPENETTGTGLGRRDSDPPGTMASRAFDEAAGTNTSGAYPHQSDGTPANPRGTAATRATDEALDTNTSGTNPRGSRA